MPVYWRQVNWRIILILSMAHSSFSKYSPRCFLWAYSNYLRLGFTGFCTFRSLATDQAWCLVPFLPCENTGIWWLVAYAHSPIITLNKAKNMLIPVWCPDQVSLHGQNHMRPIVEMSLQLLSWSLQGSKKKYFESEGNHWWSTGSPELYILEDFSSISVLLTTQNWYFLLHLC